MKEIFDLKWSCPFQNLCPRIPSRLNYLLWINHYYGFKVNKVLDIGTGATLIYPLLGFKLFEWRFVATEINKDSFESSEKIIKENNL